ncbi:MAG: hypothetical protein U0074_00905 [Kouleothrix sp.]
MMVDLPVFPGFTPELLATLETPGVTSAGRPCKSGCTRRCWHWPKHCEPKDCAASRALWLLYEVSFRSARFVNRGAHQRGPIDDYHVALDRPPRGCGILVAASGASARW